MINVIIPAAGLAKRMRPLSSNSSKAMIPINGKPIISYIIDEIKKQENIGEIIVVQNDLKDVENFCIDRYPDVKFASQKDPEGPLQAIYLGYLATENKSNSVFVWLGDTICTNQHFDFSKNFLGVHRVNDKERWCLVDKVLNYYDKPTTEVPTDTALIGLYYFADGIEFSKNIELAMKEPKFKNEYQISSVLSKYRKFELCDCAGNWYDCGELSTYYKSKALLLNNSTRKFNNIQVDTFYGTLTKSSTGDNALKIENEKAWYASLNEHQSIFVPRIFKSEFGSIKMGWESGTALNEMFLYENLSNDTWANIIDKIVDVISTTFHHPLTPDISDIVDSTEMFITKPLERIAETYKGHAGYDEVSKFVIDTGADLLKSLKYSSVIHGDLHFGNIIFDSHVGSLKLIDPRGIWGRKMTSKGDIRYDYAKLLHDWFGQYITTNAMVDIGKKRTETFEFIKSHLYKKLSTIWSKEDMELIIKLSIILAMTCAPLHSDNEPKQQLMWSKGLINIRNKAWSV